MFDSCLLFLSSQISLLELNRWDASEGAHPEPSVSPSDLLGSINEFIGQVTAMEMAFWWWLACTKTRLMSFLYTSINVRATCT